MWTVEVPGLVLSLLMVSALLHLPGGIAGGLSLWFSWREHRPSAHAKAPNPDKREPVPDDSA